MNLAALFGDDEHTAVDGAYNRLLRTRKWVYLTASSAVLLSFGLVKFQAINASLKYIEIPDWLLNQITLASLTYTSCQYALLLLQTCIVYRTILDERFDDKRQSEYQALIEKYENAQNTLAAQQGAVDYPQNSREKLIAQHQAPVTEQIITRLSERLDRLGRAPQLSAAFVASEVGVDLLRVAPPIALGIYSMRRLFALVG